MDDDFMRPLFESSGWLAAHRRNQKWLRQNPVLIRVSSIAGAVSLQNPAERGFPGWKSWSLRLLRKPEEED